MAVSRKTQRNGTFGRLNSVTADRGKKSGEQSPEPGDTLNSGNGSEEDGVDNRSEPEGWRPDGSTEAAGGSAEATPSASVKTAPPPAFGRPAAEAESEPDSEKTSKPDSGPVPSADPIPPVPAGPGETAGWESRVPGNGASGNGSYGSAGSTPSVAAAGAPGVPPMPAQYVTPDPGRGSQATATFPSPTKQRTRPQRPGKLKTPRPQPSGPRQAPAGFPAQGSPSNRKAQLAIARIEPWSVMKFSFMISLVGWVILFVAVAAMYFVLQKIGVFTSIEHTVGLVTSSKTRAGANASSWFSASRVLGYTMLIGAVNVILITALATVFAVLYNLVTVIAGGIEVTLKETD
jgi:Transmembrane domain of unknown function (DUF3566)